MILSSIGRRGFIKVGREGMGGGGLGMRFGY